MLAVAQAFGGSNGPIIVSLGGLVGQKLATTLRSSRSRSGCSTLVLLWERFDISGVDIDDALTLVETTEI